MADDTKAQLKALMVERGMLEKEVEQITSRLNSSHATSGSLLDKEGFPRSDIDVHAVRTDRHRLICLTNDHKSITLRIEKLMHSLHSTTRSSTTSGQQKPNISPAPMAIDSQPSASTPFALIDQVAGDSPASQCFQVGDRVLQIGSVVRLAGTQAGGQLLIAASKVIAENEGMEVAVRVIREGRELHLIIRPQQWSGRGLVGCHFTPI